MAAIVPLADYPVRPDRAQGESMAGYICRYLGSNGYKLSHSLHGVLNALYRGMPIDSARAAFKTVQSLLNEKVALDANKWMGRPNVAVGNHHYAWPILSFKSVNFCPACLKENGFHFRLWELPLVHACPVHGCSLLTACPRCGRKFTWTDILPNWRCRCSEAIMEMQAAPAKAGMTGLAYLIMEACDVVLPNGFNCPEIVPPLGSYRLSELYTALEWACIVRQNLSEAEATQIKFSRYRQNLLTYPARYVAWVARIFTDPTERLIKRLVRVLSRRIKKTGSMLVVIENYEVITNARQFFSEQQADNVLMDKALGALDRFFFSYRLELPVSQPVLIDPKISSKARRLACLIHFAQWWSVLSARMATLDPDIRLANPIYCNDNPLHKTLEIYIFEILEVLLNASRNNVDAETFHLFTHWWHIPESLRNFNPAHEALYQVATHLKSILMSELAFVHELVMTSKRKLIE